MPSGDDAQYMTDVVTTKVLHVGGAHARAAFKPKHASPQNTSLSHDQIVG